MESRDFVYWLQGFFEISALDPNPSDSLSPLQVECIQRHLAMVFIHEIDPSMGDKEHQDKLTDVHIDPEKLQEALDNLPDIPMPAHHRPVPWYGPPQFKC